MIGVLIVSEETSTLTRPSPDWRATASTLYSAVLREPKFVIGANVTVWPLIVPGVAPLADVGAT